MVADANIKGRRRTMVYVLSHTGQPLMPTEDHRKVRLLLKDKKAIHYRKEGSGVSSCG